MWQPTLSIVPGIVQARVAVAVAAALGLLAGLAYALRGAPWLGLGLGLPLFLLGLYISWCLWPRLRWGIGHLIADELPRALEQPLRLSFDDGPTPGLTGEILDLLAKHGVRASFFVLVGKARRHPQLVRRIVAEGHLLGLHGEDHRSPFFRPAAELHTSLCRGRAELEALAEQPVTLYRPSHGWKNLALRQAVAAAGLRLSFWDYGIWDTDAPPASTLLRRLDAVKRAGQGAKVLLLHDGRGDPPERPLHAGPLLFALRAWLPTLAK